MDEIECVVIGAGVVGLAVARALALAGREVLVLEAAEGIGTETSVAQQRGDPRRHLLPARQPDGARSASPAGACSTPSAPSTACRTATAAS